MTHTHEPVDTSRQAFLGSLIADAVAMPVHWYYDRQALARDYGTITDYLAPKNPHPDSILWRSSYTAASPKTDILREQANADWAALGSRAFRERLALHDPEIVARLKPEDRQRHVRAWEVWQATGRPLSDWQRGEASAAPWRFATVLLAPDRDWLRDRIARRFDVMMAAGVMAEVRAVFDRQPDPVWPGLKAHGAPEFFQHFRGEMTLGDVRRIAIDHTRQYAKRQMTWFRHQMTPDLVLDPRPDSDSGAIEKYLDNLTG